MARKQVVIRQVEHRECGGAIVPMTEDGKTLFLLCEICKARWITDNPVLLMRDEWVGASDVREPTPTLKEITGEIYGNRIRRTDN